MAGPALRLLEPVLDPLAAAVEPGRLVELSSEAEAGASARITSAVALLRHAQHRGETTAWIQPEGGPLFPPDLAGNGIDLASLVVVHVPAASTVTRGTPRPATALALSKAAEVLLRSGAFGLVVVDFTQGAPAPGSEAWQGRLLGLARQHHALVVLLTEKPAHADSLGTLIGLRIESRRYRDPQRRRHFVLEHAVLKNKSGAPLNVAHDDARGPWGLE